MLCFAYFHVMPEFLEFLFAFGFQSHAQDPFFASFRQRTCLPGADETLVIPELAWSGHQIQLCYNLKAAERCGSISNDWSIRDCAVHHTWDVKNVRANWIIIKGNDLMKQRIEGSTAGRSHSGISSSATLDRAFATSLGTHLLFCEWAAEQWRWYINSLENQFQDTSRRALTAPVTTLQNAKTDKGGFRMAPRTYTQSTIGSIVPRISRVSTMLTGNLSAANKEPKSPGQGPWTNPDSGLTQPLPPNITVHNPREPAPKQPQLIFENTEDQEFSFAKLQKIQHIQEKTREALLILNLNSSIISQLKGYYATVAKSRHFPQDVARLCQDDLEQFELRLTGIIEDLQMQTMRLEILSRLLEDRKTLVSQIVQSLEGARLSHHDQLHSILEYRNTGNMISMTKDMNEIARKTKIETVSMKVITVVTLFFLPGTFISVCLFSFHVSLPS